MFFANHQTAPVDGEKKKAILYTTHKTAIYTKYSIHKTAIYTKYSIHKRAIYTKYSIHKRAIYTKYSIHKTAVPSTPYSTLTTEEFLFVHSFFYRYVFLSA